MNIKGIEPRRGLGIKEGLINAQNNVHQYTILRAYYPSIEDLVGRRDELIFPLLLIYIFRNSRCGYPQLTTGFP